MMRRAIFLLAILVIQVVVVLVFARLARAIAGSISGAEVTFVACLVYGVPALGAFAGHMWFTLPRSPEIKSIGIRLLAAGFTTFFGFGFGVGALQRTDMLLTNRYIARMQQVLAAEPRFRDVRLLGYSCDYILFPYIPVVGDVASEQDRKDLDKLLKSSSAPAYVSAVIVSVGGSSPSPEEFGRRVHEE